MKTLIELTENELVCLLFWYISFRSSVVKKQIDDDLFERLNKLYDNIERKSVYLTHWTPLPKYQPGEKRDGDGWPPIFFG